MKIPKIVYHGTFWPEGVELDGTGLKTDYGYVCVTPDERWARYFAMATRWSHNKEPGNLVIYEIDTEKLPVDVIENSIPPDGFDQRLKKLNDFAWKWEIDLKEERSKIQEWRLPSVPLEAIVNKSEKFLEAEPDLNIFTVGLYRPE